MFSPILTDWPIKQKDNHRSSQGTDSWSTPWQLPGSGACFPLSRTDAKAPRLNSQSGPAAHGNEINRPWLSFKRPTYKTHETLSHCIISLPLATLTNRLQERQGWVLWRHRWIQRHWVPPPARRNDLEPVKQDIDFHIEGKKATFLSFELLDFGVFWQFLEEDNCWRLAPSRLDGGFISLFICSIAFLILEIVQQQVRPHMIEFWLACARRWQNGSALRIHNPQGHARSSP